MKHITYEERHTIEHLLGQNQSVISIAKQLSRAPSTTYRELERNADNWNQNTATISQTVRLKKDNKASVGDMLTPLKFKTMSKRN